MTTVDTFEVLTLTDEARNVVLDALNAEEHSETLALYVEVTGTRGAGYAYDLYFSDRADAPEGAAIGSDGGVTIVVPPKSVDRLRGSRLEFASEGGGGLVLVNPNAPTPEEINPGVPADILALGIDGPLALAGDRGPRVERQPGDRLPRRTRRPRSRWTKRRRSPT